MNIRKTTPICMKLVRSRIPELRASLGLNIRNTIITDSFQKQFWLTGKLAEEVAELQVAKASERIEEAADVETVLEAVKYHDVIELDRELVVEARALVAAVRRDFSQQVDEMKIKKAADKGDFKVLTLIICEFRITQK